MSRYWRTENEDGTFTNEKCYTPADMEAFAEWCSKNGWRYVESVGKEPCWERFDYTKSKWEESKTTDQLRGLWEDWKAKQRGEVKPLKCIRCGKELAKETAEHGNGTCSEYCNAKYSGYPMPSDYSEGLQKLVDICC